MALLTIIQLIIIIIIIIRVFYQVWSSFLLLLYQLFIYKCVTALKN